MCHLQVYITGYSGLERLLILWSVLCIYQCSLAGQTATEKSGLARETTINAKPAPLPHTRADSGGRWGIVRESTTNFPPGSGDLYTHLCTTAIFIKVVRFLYSARHHINSNDHVRFMYNSPLSP